MEESFEVPATSPGSNFPSFTPKLLPSLPKHWVQVGPNWYWHLEFGVPTTCQGKFQCTHHFRYAKTGTPHSQLTPAHSSLLPPCSSLLPSLPAHSLPPKIVLNIDVTSSMVKAQMRLFSQCIPIYNIPRSKLEQAGASWEWAGVSWSQLGESWSKLGASWSEFRKYFTLGGCFVLKG